MKGLLPLALVLATASYSLGAGNLVDGSDADLIYDYRTGFVTLDPTDTPSRKIFSFVLENPEGDLRPIGDEYFPIFHLGEGYNSEKLIGSTDLSLDGRDEPIPLGPIFPPGMQSPKQLYDFLEVARYSSQLAKGGDFDLIVVPEPGAGVLVWLSALVMASVVAAQRTHQRSSSRAVDSINPPIHSDHTVGSR
jgi:hypothetical protein